MELRHLRYFIAVAEVGSFTHAAVRRLHTTQPSLSRQIRELEVEVGARLLERKARGIALTAAGTRGRADARPDGCGIPAARAADDGRPLLSIRTEQR